MLLSSETLFNLELYFNPTASIALISVCCRYVAQHESISMVPERITELNRCHVFPSDCVFTVAAPEIMSQPSELAVHTVSSHCLPTS